MNIKLTFTRIKIAFIVLTPVLLLILPADFFDQGRSVCLSKFFFDITCYACGLTRGIMHLIHLEFEEAFAYNMLSFPVLPLLIVIWTQWFIKEWKTYKQLKIRGSSEVQVGKV